MSRSRCFWIISSYYKGKLAAEQLVAGLPHTIPRATQFHDLVHKVLAGAAKLPVMPLSTMSFQPVDVRDVATQLVELAQGGPRGRVPMFSVHQRPRDPERPRFFPMADSAEGLAALLAESHVNGILDS